MPEGRRLNMCAGGVFTLDADHHVSALAAAGLPYRSAEGHGCGPAEESGQERYCRIAIFKNCHFSRYLCQGGKMNICARTYCPICCAFYFRPSLTSEKIAVF